MSWGLFVCFFASGLVGDRTSERGNGDENKQQCTVHISHSNTFFQLCFFYVTKFGQLKQDLHIQNSLVWVGGGWGGVPWRSGALARWLSGTVLPVQVRGNRLFLCRRLLRCLFLLSGGVSEFAGGTHYIHHSIKNCNATR